MRNYTLALELSGKVVDNLIKNTIIKVFQKSDEKTQIEMWKFIKPFRLSLVSVFGTEENKNGYTYQLTMPKSVTHLLGKGKFEKLCSEISKVFGITAQVVTKKDIPFNAENLKSSLVHQPLLIAYELTEEQMVNVLSNVDGTANIIWIQREE